MSNAFTVSNRKLSRRGHSHTQPPANWARVSSTTTLTFITALLALVPFLALALAIAVISGLCAQILTEVLK